MGGGGGVGGGVVFFFFSSRRRHTRLVSDWSSDVCSSDLVKQMGDKVKRLYLVWADGGYSGAPFLRWVMDTLGWILQVVLRPEEAKGFVLLKRRWVVERTFGWLNWSRRLSKDYERLPASSEAMVYISMIRLMVRRLA